MEGISIISWFPIHLNRSIRYDLSKACGSLGLVLSYIMLGNQASNSNRLCIYINTSSHPASSTTKETGDKGEKLDAA